MFYDIRIMNSNRMGAVWRAAHSLDGNTTDVNLQRVCAHISKWTTDYGYHTRPHLSLRAASALVNGAARVLNKELDNLLEDCAELDSKMSEGRERKSINSSTGKSRRKKSRRGNTVSSRNCQRTPSPESYGNDSTSNSRRLDDGVEDDVMT